MEIRLPIKKGHFFYLAFPEQQTSLIEFKNSSSSANFWEANTITDSRLFYKDWFHLKDYDNVFTEENPIFPFTEVTAFAGWPFIKTPSKQNILFSNFSESKEISIKIYKDEILIEMFSLNFLESSQQLFQFYLKTPGEYKFTYFNGYFDITLLNLQGFEDLEEAKVNSAPYFFQDYSKPELTEETKPICEEELYFSIKDVIPQDTIKTIDFSSYFSESNKGIAKLLNTILFLPKKEEIKFIENLFQEDFSFALKIFENLFPFELIFLMPPTLLEEFLSLLSDEDHKLLPHVLPDNIKVLLKDSLTTTPKEGLTSEQVLSAYKKHLSAKARAFLQQKYGIKIKITSHKQTFYKSATPSIQSETFLTAMRLKSYSKSKSFGLFFTNSQWYSHKKIFSILYISVSHIYLIANEKSEKIQIIMDDFGLTREKFYDFFNIDKNEIIRLPYKKENLRLFIGVETSGKLIEMLIDLKIFKPGKNHIFFDNNPVEFPETSPVKVLSNSSSLSCFSILENNFLALSNQFIQNEKTEHEITVDLRNKSGFYFFLIDFKTQKAVFDVFFQPQQSLSKITQESVYPVQILEIYQTDSKIESTNLFSLYEKLYADFLSIYSDSSSPLLLSRFLNSLFHLYHQRHQEEHKKFLSFYLDRFYKILKPLSLTKKEKLELAYNLRYFRNNSQAWFEEKITSIFSLLEVTSINQKNPSLEFSLFELLFNEPDIKTKKTHLHRAQKALYHEKDLRMLTIALSAMNLENTKLIRKFLRKKYSFTSLNLWGDFESLVDLYIRYKIPFTADIVDAYFQPKTREPQFPTISNDGQYQVNFNSSGDQYEIIIESKVKKAHVLVFLDRFLMSPEKGRVPFTLNFNKSLSFFLIKTQKLNQTVSLILWEDASTPIFYKENLKI